MVTEDNILTLLSYEIGVDWCALYSWRNKIRRDTAVRENSGSYSCFKGIRSVGLNFNVRGFGMT